MRTVIRGTGMFVPPNVVDNDRLSRIMETSDEWVRQRTGIVTRHYADPDQASSDLAVPAAEAALKEAGLEKREVDYVIFATMTPDFYFPGSGSIFQHKLGLGHVPRDPARSSSTSSAWDMSPASTSDSNAPASCTACRSPTPWSAPSSHATSC
jgi:3-oxoacyl-[acyl-carrier-protein] synthase-3